MLSAKFLTMAYFCGMQGVKHKIEILISQFENAEKQAKQEQNLATCQKKSNYHAGKVFAYRDVLCELRLMHKMLTN